VATGSPKPYYSHRTRFGAEETYRSLQTLIKKTPRSRDVFDIDDDDVPDYSTVCKWYQDHMMEVWRLLLRHSAEIESPRDVQPSTARSSSATKFPLRFSHRRHVRQAKMTLLVDIESHAVIDIHCTTRKTPQVGMQVSWRNVGDLRLLISDKGYGWGDLRDYLRANDVRPLSNHREFTSIDVAHNARMDADMYGQ
jgi:IS5 family transposase